MARMSFTVCDTVIRTTTPTRFDPDASHSCNLAVRGTEPASKRGDVR
jgi:hypothetical protein